MSWRVITISNPARLSAKQNQLVIEQENKVTIPIEDISVLVLDSYGIQLSASTLINCAEYKVTVILCDQKHLPIAHLLPHEPHSRQLQILQRQLALTEPFKKRLWQLLIQQKIKNQGTVLQLLGLKDTITHLAATVPSGDSTNREAYASRLYFSQLLPEGSTRKHTDKFNSALNYGYAIMRSIIARNLASYGFLTSLGLHHRNELNSYNLADDFIEPYRPFVDLCIAHAIIPSSIEEDLSTEERHRIIDIINNYIKIGTEKQVLKNAIELTIQSFSTCCTSKDVQKILLPILDVDYAAIYESIGNVRSPYKIKT